jgi:hypothetical protein
MEASPMLRLLAFLAACTVCCLPTLAGDHPGDQEGPPPMILSYLAGVGVETDTASLLAAAERHDDPTVQWAATTLLAERQVPEAGGLFRRLLASSSRDLREAAAFGLARLGDDEGLAVLEELLETAVDGMERIHLAEQLARLGRSSGYAYVAEALGHAPEAVDGGRDSSSAAKDAPEEDSPAPEAVRVSAVSTLPAFFEPGVVGSNVQPAPSVLLLSAAQDPSAAVRREVLTQISRIVYLRHLAVAEVRPVVETMAQSDPDPSVRRQAETLLSAWRAEEEQTGVRDGGNRS